MVVRYVGEAHISDLAPSVCSRDVSALSVRGHQLQTVADVSNIVERAVLEQTGLLTRPDTLQRSTSVLISWRATFRPQLLPGALGVVGSSRMGLAGGWRRPANSEGKTRVHHVLGVTSLSWFVGM